MPHPVRRARLALLLAGALALGPMAVSPALAAPSEDAAASTAAPSEDATAITSPSRTAEVSPGTELAGTAAAADTVAVPTLSGELAVGQTVEAVWPDGTPESYAWLADGAVVAGATGPAITLTSAQAKAVLEVQITGTAPDGSPVTVTSASRLRVATTGTPTVSGTTAVGSTVTASPGTWTYNTALTYQWLADGAPIPGATARTLVLTGAQSGRAIAVRVTGTKAGYQTLSRTSAVAARRVMGWTAPAVAGTLAVGSTVTAEAGAWTSGTTFTYQWYANGAALAGATARTLKLGTAHKDKTLSVRVTGSKSGHTTVAKTSRATLKVATAGTPKVSGTAVAGGTLTATPGTWTPSTSLSYQWYADGVAISGATSSTLKLGSATKDHRIRVKVTGRKAGYATVTKSSSSTLRVQTAPTPKATGTPRVTYTLTASRGTWSSGTSFTYQWYANGTAISGATGSTLRLGTAHVGKTIKVKVTGRKSGYPTLARTSAATAAVTYPSSTPGLSTGECPSWAPIKGNANSMIYHMPGGRWYKITKAEECFRTESAAVAAGYRKAKG